MMTVAHVAKRLQVSAAPVYQLVESLSQACYRIGRTGTRGAIRVSEEQLLAFLEGQKREKGQEAAKLPAPRRVVNPAPTLQNLKLKPS